MPTGPYPDNWPVISERIRERAAGRCECSGQCGLHRGNRCEEFNGTDAKWASGKVVLTVAHLNHYPPDCRDANLLAMCNTCHLRYDQVLHSHHAFLARRQDKAIGDMFGQQERYEGKVTTP